MNNSIRIVATSCIAGSVVVGMLLLGASPSWAQQKAERLKEQIAGGWTLGSVVLEQGGKKIEPYGPNPKGFALFHPDGRFSYMIFRSDLPRIASGNRFTATPEEMKAIYLGTIAYYGTYTVDEKSGTLPLNIEVSNFTNWSGTILNRLITISGDEMKLINPDPPTGGKSYIVWKRAK